ncbi:low-temperature-induced 65 kDa protein-like, partial [Impatiens glandulifera]|uniref:low-temperature-induced 65 kDa protein-like n=1 Tax=Impatiens glandulifera TaxID=253017 RepID=UPI001FB12915
FSCFTKGQEEDVRSSQHPPEKIKSVFKKVKDKAKKIKNTLTKHGHDHDSSHDEEEEDYDDDDDHGDVEISHQMAKQSDHPPAESEKNQDGEISGSKILRRESVVKDDPMNLDEDSNYPKSNLLPSNDSTRMGKLFDLCAGVTSIDHSFNRMNIHGGDKVKEEHKPNMKTPDLLTDRKQKTGTHVQFSPELSPKPDDPTTATAADSAPSYYLDKLSSAASTFSDKAIAAKDAVASKLGYGGGGGEGRESGQKLTVLMSEKLSPGEEDKALSETISDALEWRKAEPEKKEGEKVMGKVTVSDEVANRLGSCDDYKNPSGDGKKKGKLPEVSDTMVERIKGTVGSWLGIRSGASGQSEAALGTTTITTAGGGGGGNVEGKRQGE